MCFYLRNWQVTLLLYTLGVFISEYIAKAFTEPHGYRVVFLIQGKASVFRRWLITKAYHIFVVAVFTDALLYNIPDLLPGKSDQHFYNPQ